MAITEIDDETSIMMGTPPNTEAALSGSWLR